VPKRTQILGYCIGTLSSIARKKGNRVFLTYTEVARERFELSSRAPEAPMLDRYTTGLHSKTSEQGFHIITLALFHPPFFSISASRTQQHP
jgi:hypothetical protein